MWYIYLGIIHKYICICLYTGILLSHKKEGHFAICKNMTEFRGHYVK